MIDSMRVILELGAKRRVVGGATKWPGVEPLGNVGDPRR